MIINTLQQILQLMSSRRAEMPSFLGQFSGMACGAVAREYFRPFRQMRKNFSKKTANKGFHSVFTGFWGLTRSFGA